MSLTLHKVTTGQYDMTAEDLDTGHVFTFVWDDVTRLQTMTSSSVRSIESNEVKFGGHSWSVVVTSKVSHSSPLCTADIVMSLSVCLSVTRISQKPHVQTSSTFCACCLWPWLSPCPAAL